MKHDSLIGNYLTTAPGAIAFVVDDKAAFVVDTGAPFFAGPSAPDESYRRIQFTKDGSNVHFEWGRVGDCAVGRFSSDKAVRIHLKLTQSWPGITTEYKVSEAGATGLSAGVAWSLKTLPKPASEGPGEMIVDASPHRPAYFVAGIGRLPSFDGIDDRLESACAEYEARRPSASGDWGDFLGAIADNLNNSRVYSTDNHLLAHTVARGWAHDANTAPYFCWDSFFNGNLACLNDPQTGRETVRAILSYQTPNGLVPNFGHALFDGIRSSDDRSQPPVGALCIWKMHRRWPDKDFLEEVYPKLVKWHRWWAAARDGNNNGLLEWGSETGTLQGALWETGWDPT